MIENILILDTETTGLYPEKGAKLIEMAVVLYNLKYKCVLQSFATLLPCTENPVEDINHINPLATQCKYYYKETYETLKYMVYAAQCCVAHNASFDKRFTALLPNPYNEYLLNTRWICTLNDFKWPIDLPRKRLSDICEAMGVPYVDAHRALQDCFLLAQCFSKIEDLEVRFNSL